MGLHPLRQRRRPKDRAAFALDRGFRFVRAVEGERGPDRIVRRFAAHEIAAARVMPAIELQQATAHEANHTPALAQAGEVAVCDVIVIDVALLMVSWAAVAGLLATAG